MIDHPSFSVAPWELCEESLDLAVLAQTESIFALSNGHIGVRANLDEGEPHANPGTYLAGVHEVRPLPYAEAAYGDPESGETVVNVPDAKTIRLLVGDEPFDVRYGRLHAHRRTLDLRAGVLRREADWESPAGGRVRVNSTRLVSLVQRAVMAIHYEVEAVDAMARIVLQSELVANQAVPTHSDDPRAAAALTDPLVGEEHEDVDAIVMAVHHVRQSGLRVGSGIDHEIDAPRPADIGRRSYPDGGRITVATDLEPGERLRIVKYAAYGWSGVRSREALRAQVVGALAEARHTGWDGLLAAQGEYLDAFWDRADVELEGDPELQQALRFALFHVLQAGARAEGRALAAKGLTGPGYDGHAFWDTEAYVLPVLTYTAPDAVVGALRWRHSTIPLAQERARQLGLEGTAFPWRTITGRECSGYWPAGTAAFHVNAAIAAAAVRYVEATGDEGFAAETGLELVVGTARMWCSLGHAGRDGMFRIDGVTGPDEYSAVADNNVYTNLMAQRNLRAAAAAADRLADAAGELGVTEPEIARWRAVADSVYVPRNGEHGLIPQADGFLDHARWDFDRTGADEYPLFLHHPYFKLYRSQVVKQADLVLALYARGDAFTAEEKRQTFDYYEGITVRDSSLSACVQSVMAAEVGHLELAHDLFAEAALTDLTDHAHNTRDGLHIASLAGAWICAVAGFGGMRDHDGRLTFAPRLPPALTRLAFRLHVRGARLAVEVTHGEATYTISGGDPLELAHHGEPLTVTPGAPVTRPTPPHVEQERPPEPLGREPERRGARS